MVFKDKVKTQKELLELKDNINDQIITSDKSIWLNHSSVNKNNCVVINEKFVQIEPLGGEHWELMFHWVYKNLNINLEDALYDESIEDWDTNRLWNYIDSYNRCCFNAGNIAFIEQYSTDMTYAPDKTPNFEKVAKVLQEQLGVKKVYLDQLGYFQDLIRKANRQRK